MFSSRLPLFAALLAAIDAVAAQSDDPLSCDDPWISIANQTEIDFYKNCPDLSDAAIGFFVGHEFKGPFELPGVKSIPKLSSGYLLPKLSVSDRVDDGVTSISMPDLTNITLGGIWIGYVDNVTSLSFPKLESITGDIAIIDSYGLKKLSLPSLKTINGGIYLDGHFDEINLPSLKSLSYFKVVSIGDIDCTALGKAYANLTFTGGEDAEFKGLTCYTPYNGNAWNSSDPNPSKTGGGDGGSGGTSTGGTGSGPDKDNAGNVSRINYGVGTLLLAFGLVFCL